MYYCGPHTTSSFIRQSWRPFHYIIRGWFRDLSAYPSSPDFTAGLRPRGEAVEWEETRAAVVAADWKWFHLPTTRDTETATATAEAVHGWLIARSVAHLDSSSSEDAGVGRAAVIHSALMSNEARCAALRHNCSWTSICLHIHRDGAAGELPQRLC